MRVVAIIDRQPTAKKMYPVTICSRVVNGQVGYCGDNILTSTFKWARRADENFTSEAFASVLRTVIALDSRAASSLLDRVTVGCIRQAEGATVDTQFSLAEGRPDILIRSGKRIVCIECKVEAPASPHQTEKYQKALGSSARIVLLTKYFVPTRPRAIAWIRWRELAEWMRATARRTRSPIARARLHEFVDFMKWRNLTMEPIRSNVGPGARSLRNLLDMMAEALGRAGHRRMRVSWDDGWVGYVVDERKLAFGLSLEATSAADQVIVERRVFRGHDWQQVAAISVAALAKEPRERQEHLLHVVLDEGLEARIRATEKTRRSASGTRG